MSARERLVEELLSRGLERLQRRLDVAGLQRQYGAYGERVVRFRIMDVVMSPVCFQVRNGRVNRLPGEFLSDNRVTFLYLNDLLDVLNGGLTIQQIFAWNGFRRVRGRWVRCVFFDGDIGQGALILQRVMSDYIEALREVMKEMTLLRYVVRPVAMVKQAFVTQKGLPIEESQGVAP